MSKKTKTESDYADIEKRLLSNYEHAVSQYELLLLILKGDTRANVAPLAHLLIKKFGTLGDIIGADLDKLRAIDGMSEKRLMRLRLVQFSALRLLNPGGRASVTH